MRQRHSTVLWFSGIALLVGATSLMCFLCFNKGKHHNAKQQQQQQKKSSQAPQLSVLHSSQLLPTLLSRVLRIVANKLPPVNSLLCDSTHNLIYVFCDEFRKILSIDLNSPSLFVSTVCEDEMSCGEEWVKLQQNVSAGVDRKSNKSRYDFESVSGVMMLGVLDEADNTVASYRLLLPAELKFQHFAFNSVTKQLYVDDAATATIWEIGIDLPK